VTTDPTNAGQPAAATRPPGRRWALVAANVLLVVAIVALLVATWMPAIYDRLATTRPSP
jgi:cytochrome c biogenesis factor